MSVVQYKKYFWLVDTIRSAGRISREEIDRKWASARINDNHESRLPESTFFRYKNAIEELFDIEILCDRATGQYYIDDTDINSRTKQWLLSQFAVSQSLDTSRELRDSSGLWLPRSISFSNSARMVPTLKCLHRTPCANSSPRKPGKC